MTEKHNLSEVLIATPEDARGIKEISYYSWLATYPNEKEGITLDDIKERLKNALSEEKIAEKARQISNSEDERYLVVKDSDKPVGYCHVKKYPDRNQLHAIYILPEYLGQGIGTKLWDEAKKFFDPTKDTKVEVATYNKNAINFYRKLGFKDTERVFTDEKLRMNSGSIITETEMIIKAGN